MDSQEPQSQAKSDDQSLINQEAGEKKKSDLEPKANAQPAPDAMLSCLAYVCRHFGKFVSEDALISGLPLQDGRLTAPLFVRAANRQHINAVTQELPLAELPRLDLPVVILLEGQRALVVKSIDQSRNSMLISEPAIQKHDFHVSLAEINQSYKGFFFTFELQSSFGRTSDASETGVNEHWFWSSIRRFWKSYLHVILAALLINLLGLAVPLFIMNVYDRVVPNFAFPTLWALSIGVCLALIFDFLLKNARSQMLNHVGAKADTLLGAKLFEHIMRLDMARRPASAGAFANQIREFETVREFFTSSSLVSLIDMLFIGISLFVLFILVGPVVWVPICAVPLVILIALFIQKPLSSSIDIAQNESANRHSVLIEAISNLETIRALRAENRMQAQWERSVSAAAKAQQSGRYWSQIAITLSALVQTSVSVLIIILGVYLVSLGEITVGAMIAASMISGRVLAPMGNVVSTLTRLRQTISSFKTINQIMELEEETGTNRTMISKSVDEGVIEARNITFRYPEAVQDALIEFNLTVSQGERIGVIGKVGSGKTTLGRLMSGLYYPSAGSLLVDGVDTRQYDPSSLRKGVGFVGQDASLFFGTVRDNIAISNPQIDDETLIAAARISGADDFIKRHPLGYDMPVGENGRLLSGGQRQAIALARTLVLQPKILFLDEPSSNLDMSAEALLVKRLKSINESGTTLFIATHRTSLLDLVDRLLVFNNGKLVMDGPKQKVLAKLKDMQGEGEAG